MRTVILSALLFASSASAAGFPVQGNGKASFPVAAACRCLKDQGSSKVTIEVRADRKGKVSSVWVDPAQKPEVAACLERTMGLYRWEPFAQVRHTLVVIDFPQGPRLK